MSILKDALVSNLVVKDHTVANKLSANTAVLANATVENLTVLNNVILPPTEPIDTSLTVTADTGSATSVANTLSINGTAKQIETTGSGSKVALSIPATFELGSIAGSDSGTIAAGTGGLDIKTSTGTIKINNDTGNIDIGSNGATGFLYLGYGTTNGQVYIGSPSSDSTVRLYSGLGLNAGIFFNSNNTNLGATTISTPSPSNFTSINSTVGRATFTGFSIASGGATPLTFIINNSKLTNSTSGAIVTAALANASLTQKIQVTNVIISHDNGSIIVEVVNGGSVATNTNIIISFIVLPP